jgi:hypothetical protein
VSDLTNSVNQLVRDYDEGLYTLTETNWRLLQLVESADQIAALIARLPAEFAAGWLVWARNSFGGNEGEYFVLGRGPVDPREKAAIDALRVWLAGQG